MVGGELIEYRGRGMVVGIGSQKDVGGVGGEVISCGFSWGKDGDLCVTGDISEQGVT